MKKLIFIALLFTSFPLMANDKAIEILADNALEWNRALSTFTATGNATITQGSDKIIAPTITANYTDTEDGTVINSITASSSATLSREGQILTADKIIAHFENGELNTVDATENVVLKTDKETLYGDKATYNALKQHVLITGDVRIEQGSNLLSGDRAEFDLQKNISTLTASKNHNNSRVKATFFTKGGKDDQ